MTTSHRLPVVVIALAVLATARCGGAEAPNVPSGTGSADVKEGACEVTPPLAPDFTKRLGCKADLLALASEPLDSSIPGARSVKFVLDQRDGDNLYFQNTNKYKVHWDFASNNLSGNGRPIVPALAQFNQSEYYSPGRRFLLGAVTYYEGPGVWAFEIAPYDTASAAMIAKAFRAVAAATYFGSQLQFHPTSEAVEREAALLPPTVPIKTTKDLFSQIEFLPLNVSSSVGRLRFMKVDELDTTCISFRDIVVLDRVPNDLSVTMGIVTGEFQTPLSHINVLARNRKIPNMWLRDAFTNARLRSLKGKWVKLTVGTSTYAIEESSSSEADSWWQAHRPAKLTIPRADITKTGLVDVTKVIAPSKPLADELPAAILAFGGKASHYAAMAGAAIVPMPTPRGFVIPVAYYDQFMEQNGFYKEIDALLADPAFTSGDCKTQAGRLGVLRDRMKMAPVDPAFERMLIEKMTTEYSGLSLRFRSSSTAEDVGGFTGAGLYTSETGTLGDPSLKQPLTAIRQVWASVWFARGFQERDYRQLDQRAVGMAILAHPRFAKETASGVAQTANSYDRSGLQPGFVVNVQKDNGSVTLPGPGETTDQFIYYFESMNQPTQYLQHSNQIPAGQTVLSRTQIYQLGKALDAIHKFFRPVYGPPPSDPGAWYALEVDFKFEVASGAIEPSLFIKQARPLPAPF